MNRGAGTLSGNRHPPDIGDSAIGPVLTGKKQRDPLIVTVWGGSILAYLILMSLIRDSNLSRSRPTPPFPGY
jgi:hypothetical protein